MRKVTGITAVVLVLAFGAFAAWAEQGPASGTGPAMQGAGGNRETFSERKARILKLFDERKTRLEQEKACVDAAQNDEDLMKCRPQRPMRGGEGGPDGRRGGPRPQMPMGGGEQ
ncbi:MAG: hypothetical protein M0042_16165 [Nitrospiraceae bacterium]|nr:hypothetical protein [Nitrospiraceae bacterium]